MLFYMNLMVTTKQKPINRYTKIKRKEYKHTLKKIIKSQWKITSEERNRELQNHPKTN